MVKKTKITINDKNGIKTYKFSENFIFQIKILVMFFAIFLSLLIFAIFKMYINNLNLKNLNKTLYETNLILVSKVNQTSKKLDITNEKMQDLEIAAAFSSIDNELKDQKTSDLKISSNLMNLFFVNIPNGYPVENKGITDFYGMRIHPISKTERMHHGIDLRAAVGTAVRATADGFIEYAADSATGYGYLVIISHNYGFKTRYGHLYNKDTVKVGQWVKKGDIIGYSGNTGYSTGPHLHYEVRFLERTIDPLNFMKWQRENFTYVFNKERKIPWQSIAYAISGK